jgi:methyl-accepting chemotaxis protein
VKKINNMDVELTFEQEDGLVLVNKLIAQCEEHLKAVVDIHKGDKARMDAFLVKSEVGPLLSRIDSNLQSLVDGLRRSTARTGEALVEQAASTKNIVTTLLVAGLIIGALLAITITAVIVTPLRDAAIALDDIAEGEGDLTRRLEQHGNDEIAHMAGGFNRFIGKIRQIIQQVAEAVSQLNASTEEMGNATSQSTQTIMQQKEETAQIATAVSEMSASARDVARHAELTAEAASQADKDTSQSRQVVTQALEGIQALGSEIQQTADVIQRLGDDMQSIGEIINVIRGVTEQTNLLALNAAIEAARAGEQGRGFAVVADEVRTLADRANQSTNEISEKVGSLLQHAQSAVKRMQNNSDAAQSVVGLANNASESLEAVTQAVSRINDMTYQIASAAEQQSKVAEEVDTNIENISQMATSADEAARLVSNGSASLQQMAENLNGMVARFKV